MVVSFCSPFSVFDSNFLLKSQFLYATPLGRKKGQTFFYKHIALPNQGMNVLMTLSGAEIETRQLGQNVSNSWNTLIDKQPQSHYATASNSAKSRA
ncbi:hypothetical protein C6501_10475 [Candidatus Poribacteria bacterium]|nr:MAG: hypothetical protein C6501_10475 [Candidatus Poribacteria bacterium]